MSTKHLDFSDEKCKKVLLAKLGQTKDNYLIGFAAVYLLDHPRIDEILKGKVCLSYQPGEEIVNLDEVREAIGDDKVKQSFLQTFLTFQNEDSC